MYAIVEINGQQFKVEEGKRLFVNHMQNVEGGQTVEFEKVLLVENNGEVTVGLPTVEGAFAKLRAHSLRVTRFSYSTRSVVKVTAN